MANQSDIAEPRNPEVRAGRVGDDDGSTRLWHDIQSTSVVGGFTDLDRAARRAERTGYPFDSGESRPALKWTSMKSALFHVSEHETLVAMKGQDVVILLKLHGPMGQASIRDLGSSMGYDVAGTHRSLSRLSDAGLWLPDQRRVMRAPAEEFLRSAVKFMFPAVRGGERRGVPTAWARPPLQAELAGDDLLPPVWPHPEGTARGLSLEPLHPMVPAAALDDEDLWRRLALVDAIRSRASARISSLAEDLLIADLRA